MADKPSLTIVPEASPRRSYSRREAGEWVRANTTSRDDKSQRELQDILGLSRSNVRTVLADVYGPEPADKPKPRGRPPKRKKTIALVEPQRPVEPPPPPAASPPMAPPPAPAPTPPAPAKPTTRPYAAIGKAIQWAGWALVPAAVFVNAQTGWSYGSTDEARLTFAYISMLADVFVVLLPMGAGAAYHGRMWVVSAVFWTLSAVVIAAAVQASVGFGSRNLEDTSAARAAALKNVQAATAKRDAAIAAATVAKQDASRSAAAECQKRGPRCRENEKLEQERATILDKALAAELPVLPAFADPDPQVTGGLRLAQWVGLSPTEQDIVNLRLAIIALLPNLSGLVIALGAALRRK